MIVFSPEITQVAFIGEPIVRDLIDLETYSLDRPESEEYAALVSRCRGRGYPGTGE